MFPKELSERFAFAYPTLLKYLENKINNLNICSLFYKNNYSSIAIYGLGGVYGLGRLFFDDIKNSDINIKYFIDKNLHSKYPEGYSGIPVISLDSLPEQEPVDVIVVTPVFYYNEIVNDLMGLKISLDKIISITDVVYDM